MVLSRRHSISTSFSPVSRTNSSANLPSSLNPEDGQTVPYPKGKTFAGQKKLPKLPIPKLEETMARYLKALEGLQSPADHSRTRAVVQAFLENEGPALHESLKDYAAQRDSYIEEWWTESYLSHSDSVVLSLNPFFILEDDPTPTHSAQLPRAVSLILSTCAFIHDLRTGQLEPDAFRGVPLDMSQYMKLFGTSRIPTKTGCRLEVESESRHCVVMVGGGIYWFDVLDSHHRPLLTDRSLLTNLTSILSDAASPSTAKSTLPLGVLTTDKRATWASHRAKLRENEANRVCLEIVDKALFVVCLDDETPDGVGRLCENMLCGTSRVTNGRQVGTCQNRWYDKLQIIVCKNGAAGINFEHSGVDGHTVLRYVADIYTELILRFARSINSASGTLFKAKLSPWATGGPAQKKKGSAGDDEEEEEREEVDTEPKKLEWVVDEELQGAVNFAETRLSDLICQNEAVALEFAGYGKNAITQHGFSPDAFVQMAYQAAYYSLYGKLESVYEPAMTKNFLHGRTEAIRSVTPDSLAFVRAYTSPTATRREKIESLRNACKAHTSLTKACAAGLGQDRILYALYCLAQRQLANEEKQEREMNNPSSSSAAGADNGSGSDGEESSVGSSSGAGGVSETVASRIPDLFKDSGYALLGHSTLSTSNCGNPALRLFGFGPVVSDGFGLGYIIKDESIAICASSKHRQTSRFLDAIRSYFEETMAMLKKLHQESNRKPNSVFVDHFAGEISAKTGQPISHLRNGSLEKGAEDLSYSDGYGFYGSLSEAVNGEKGGRRETRVKAGIRIRTVEP